MCFKSMIRRTRSQLSGFDWLKASSPAGQLVVILVCFVFSANGGFTQEPVANVPPEHAQQMKAGLELFNSKIQTLLQEHCLDCHGGSSVEADFDLSTRESLLASGFIDLKTVEESHLLAVVRHESEPHMPKDGERLSDDKLADFRRWLELGAPYASPLIEPKDQAEQSKPSAISNAEREFWAFRPLVPVAPPRNRSAVAEKWVRTPIDHFVLEQLEKLNIRPNASADRRRLIRRAYFDLIGLPPPPEEVEKFVQDQDPLAYEKLIDRLLQLPQYGERWARHWMDISRFAESHGYEQDYDRPTAYHYRDFLIKALNADMPYDQFVRWQIAGDELAPQDPLAMMATGFLGAGAFPTQLTEAEFESSRYDELDDMIGTLGTSVLGLSVGCARCHTHKFDPIPVTDYYRFAANMATAIRSEVELELDPLESEKYRREFETDLAVAEAELKKYEEEKLASDIQAWLQQWEPANPESIGPWRGGSIKHVATASGNQLALQGDGSWFAEGGSPNKDTYTFTCQLSDAPWQALRLECLADERLPNRGPGRAGNGNFALGDIYLRIKGKSDAERIVRFATASATHQQNNDTLSVAASIDDDPISGWAVDGGGIGKDQAALFELAEPLKLSSEEEVEVVLVCNHPNGAHIPGRIRLAWSTEKGLTPAVGKAEIDASVLEALTRLKEKWDVNSPDYSIVKGWMSGQLANYKKVQERVAEIKKQGPKSTKQKVLVTTEGMPHLPHHADGRGFPHFYPQTYVLIRGDVHQKRSEAVPGYLQILMRNGKTEDHWKVSAPEGWTRTSFRRASLANWLMDVKDGAGHLAARVIVNRLWQHHFGKGLVATASDFGKQGDLPSHPELLEWLATDLVQNGWRLKRVHKMIMTSAVYMQSSQALTTEAENLFAADRGVNQDRAAVDRENKYLWKFPVRRLEAEAIRDTLLAVSGDLDLTQFGPGTLDQGMKRRSIYFFIKRSQLIPMMLLFDWPEHQVGIGQRSVTTIAPQALAFMNSPYARQYAASFAKRLSADEDQVKVQLAYNLAFGRPAETHEIEIANRFLAQQVETYQQQGVNDAKSMAWVDYCQALLSMNELIYVD